MRTIAIRTRRTKGRIGWMIHSTDGETVRDRINTQDPIEATAHVNRLVGKGYQFKPYALSRWQTLQGEAKAQEVKLAELCARSRRSCPGCDWQFLCEDARREVSERLREEYIAALPEWKRRYHYGRN